MASTLFLRRGGPFRWWRELHAGFSSFRKPNGNCLLRILDAVLPFPHVVDLFADELSCLCGWRFAFASVLAGAFYSLFFRHISSSDSPLPVV